MQADKKPYRNPRTSRYRFRLIHLFVVTLIVAGVAHFINVERQRRSEERDRYRRLSEAGGVLNESSLRFRTRATDDSLAVVSEFDAVRDVDLRGTEITDAGLAHLANPSDILTINLSGLPITDEGVRHLAKLPKLIGLNLTGTRITDRALGELAAISQLLGVTLTGTAVSDAGISHFVGHQSLGQIELDGTNVTTEGIKTLADCEQLEFLMLDDSQLDDGVVDALKRLPRLRSLRIYPANGGPMDLEFIKKELPRVRVSRRPQR